MRRQSGKVILCAAFSVTLACAHDAPVGAGLSEGEGGPERRLATAKAAIMSADYRADLPALTRLREEVLPLGPDPELGYLAHYWAGFASWRIALNGANHGMSAADLREHLEAAAADFEVSARLHPRFADAVAAGASVNGWLIGFHRDDPEATKRRIGRATELLKQAAELEPGNPRVLWVQAGDFLFRPTAIGGDPQRAIEIYRRAVALSERPSPQSPAPDWGKAEALMGLAYAHLHHVPDLVAAEREARAALELRPEWSYVRDILLPQIERARR